MVFRRDSKVDAFQRQISALRHQLGGESDELVREQREQTPSPFDESYYRSDLPELDLIRPETAASQPVARMHMPPAMIEHPHSEPAALPAVDTHTSVIAHSTSWNGTLESSGSLHVHGRVEGTLVARNDIFIAEEAEIDAVVSAATVMVAGNVRGSINCSDRFEVLPRGRVIGDVRAPVIVIHDGALVAGEIAMSAASDARTPSSAIEPRSARGGG